MSEFQRLQDELGEWSDEAFGATKGPSPCIAHLKKEVEELAKNPYDEEEYGDCLMLLVDAWRRVGRNVSELLSATFAKLKVCKDREWGEPDSDGVSEHIKEKEYVMNWKKETCIPANLEECLTFLEDIITLEELDHVKSADSMYVYHFGFGMNLRNQWGLWHESRLALWFKERGVQHPDDMSGIILESFRRHVQGLPIDFESQAAEFAKHCKNCETLLLPCPFCDGKAEFATAINNLQEEVKFIRCTKCFNSTTRFVTLGDCDHLITEAWNRRTGRIGTKLEALIKAIQKFLSDAEFTPPWESAGVKWVHILQPVVKALSAISEEKEESNVSDN